MPYVGPRPEISFGLVDGRPIFLDLAADCYVALDGVAEQAVLRAVGDAAVPAGTATAEILLGTGLFRITGKPERLEPVRVHLATAGIEDDGRGLRSAAPADVAETAVLLWRTRRALARLPLETVMARLGDRNAIAAAGSQSAAMAARFARARAFVPIRRSCLQDSLALRAWLARRSAAALVVLGVKLDPFGAHCWVQAGDRILNDAPDRTGQFTPVLVLP